MGAACCGSHRYVAASKAPTPVVCLRARKLSLSSTHISPGQDVVGRVLAGLARLRAQPRLRAFAKQFHHGGVVLVALARRVDGVQPLAEGHIGLGIQVAVAVQGEADRGMSGSGGDLLGVGPAAIQRATAVWRRSWIRSPSRPAALVAGRHTRARNAVTRSGPPCGALNTKASGSSRPARQPRKGHTMTEAAVSFAGNSPTSPRSATPKAGSPERCSGWPSRTSLTRHAST